MTAYSLKRILWESYPVLILCAVISLSAGLILQSQLESIKTLPLILVMVPPINGINNNVCSILGSRLTSALHIGTIDPKFGKQAVLRRNVQATWLMSLGVFVFTSVIFFAMALIFGINPVQSVAIMGAFFLASMVAIGVTMFCTVWLAFVSFSKGLDPDNVVIPIVTSIGDIIGVTCLIMAMKIIGV
ncbi:MAG: magnesium transporter [Candidatus Hadarchaeum sp.]|uniref:magnesium transporter n=1 Tax=Candidatus Hadarchaeum sp. TaxID=2883567 RepID=UPI0031706F0B